MQASKPLRPSSKDCVSFQPAPLAYPLRIRWAGGRPFYPTCPLLLLDKEDHGPERLSGMPKWTQQSGSRAGARPGVSGLWFWLPSLYIPLASQVSTQ